MQVRLAEVADEKSIQKVAELAPIIWNEHYPAIIGQSQVDYMLDRFQSADAIRHQILDGYRYYLIQVGDVNAGYTAVTAGPDQHSLQLSKLYVLAALRGCGIARSAVNQMAALARVEGYAQLYLTVNKHNHDSIAAYRKLGFVHCGEMVTDIGNGYVMDDYAMQLPLSAGS